MYSKVLALAVESRRVLEHRVVSRIEDGFGKNSHELANLMSWQLDFADDYAKRGAVIIDASLPLMQVEGAIIGAATKD